MGSPAAGCTGPRQSPASWRATTSSFPTYPGSGSRSRSTDCTPGRSLTGSLDLIRQTCVEEPTLVAHSLLGSLAPFATGHGDHLRRLLIYAAPGLGPYRLPLGLLIAAIRFDVRPSQPNLERFERWAFHDIDGARRQDPEWFGAFDAYMVARGAVPHVKRTMRQLTRVGAKQVPETELRRTAVPTALLWGRHDRMVPLALAEAAGRRLGWPLHVIDRAGHVPHLEQADAFQGALQRALESSPERMTAS